MQHSGFEFRERRERSCEGVRGGFGQPSWRPAEAMRGRTSGCRMSTLRKLQEEPPTKNCPQEQVTGDLEVGETRMGELSQVLETTTARKMVKTAR